MNQPAVPANLSRRDCLTALGLGALLQGCNCKEIEEKITRERTASDLFIKKAQEQGEQKKAEALIADRDKSIRRLNLELRNCRIFASIEPLLAVGVLMPEGVQQSPEDDTPLPTVVLPLQFLRGPDLSSTPPGRPLRYILDAFQADKVVIFDDRMNQVTGSIALAPSMGPLGGAQDMVLTPDGRLLLVTSANAQPNLAVINTRTRAVSGRLMFPANRFPSLIAAAHDNRHAYAIVYEGASIFQPTAAYLEILDLTGPSRIGEIRLPAGLQSQPKSLGVTPDGGLAVLHARDAAGNHLHILDLRSRTVAISFFRTNAESSILSADGTRLYVGATNELQQDQSRLISIQVVDVASATVIAKVPIRETGSTKLALDPLCGTLLVGGPFNETLQVIQTELLQVTDEIPVRLGVNRLLVG
jgi:hypothetical protein